MAYPRYSDLNGVYICGCGLTVDKDEYNRCLEGEIHPNNRGTGDFPTISNDKNIISSMITRVRGVYYVVYDREKFFADYGDQISGFLVYQRPPTLFDFKFAIASQEEIKSCLEAHLSNFCIQTLPCCFDLVLKIKNEGDPYEMYRKVNMTVSEIREYFEKKGTLNMGSFPKVIFDSL